MSANVPKAELHVHLEGTAGPDLVRRLAARHGQVLPAELFNGSGGFHWRDFLHFLQVYDLASSVIRTPRDYRDVTYEYLASCAAEGVVYGELMSSPDHGMAAGMSYQDHLDGIAQGIEDARGEFGIEAFIVVTCVRHFGVERAHVVADAVLAHPHPLVVGFGMGGDEAGFRPGMFAEVFAKVNDGGLPCTVHAGEFDGPEGIREALETLPVKRLGHGVRAVEDAGLVDELAARGIVLELCPTSNIATGLYADYGAHPWPALQAAGCLVTLSSDDPPYFHTTVGAEYGHAARHFGLDEDDLRAVTRVSIEAGFAPAATRQAIIAKAGL
ncbi:MAG: adenosine deaminase [Alphaproteobacteria bacterium]